jgi:hypothetical protein
MRMTAFRNGVPPEGSITGTIKGKKGGTIPNGVGAWLTKRQQESTAFHKMKCVNSDPPLIASVAALH